MLLFLEQVDAEATDIFNDGVIDGNAIEYHHERVVVIGEQLFGMMPKHGILPNHWVNRVFKDDSAFTPADGDSSVFEITLKILLRQHDGVVA